MPDNAEEDKITILLAEGGVYTVSAAKSKHWFTTSFRQPLPYLVYAIGSRKLSANEQVVCLLFFCAQTVVGLLQTTQIIPDFCFITDHVAYASSNRTKIV